MSLQKPRKPNATSAAVNAPAPITTTEERLLRIADVMAMVGLKKSTVYAQIRAGKLPPPTHTTQRASVWKLSELQAYINGTYSPPNATTSAILLKLVRPVRGVKHG